MWTRTCLRVVLYAECRTVFQSDALHGIVIQIDMGSFYKTWRIIHRLFEHPKAVVLAGDLTESGTEVFHRVIESAVAMMEFIGGQTGRQRKQLLAEADAKKRFAISEHFFHSFHCIRHGSRVAGAIGKKVTRWIPVLYRFIICFGREHLQVTIALIEAAKDVLFNPKIHNGYPVFRFGVTDKIRLPGTYTARKFEAFHAGGCSKPALQLVQIFNF